MARIVRRIENPRGAHFPSKPVVLCECGEEVVCYGFTNTCVCGADYNHAGQRLAARVHWGEETGESAADILDPNPRPEDS